MKKSTYIFVLLLLSVSFFNIQPFGSWFAASNGVVGLIFLYAWMLIGFIIYNGNTSHDLYTRKNNAPALWILVGIFLSMIPAYLYYNQSFSVSLVAYRRHYFWIVILMVLYIRPEEKDIIKPLNWFGILYFVAALMKTYFIPQVFYFSDDIQEKMAAYSENDLVLTAGIALLLYPLYYYCGKLKEQFSFMSILMVLLYLVFFFLFQNRSTLFIAVIIAGFALVSSKNKFWIPIIIVIAFSLFYLTQDVWLSLREETVSQLGNTDYARVIAFNYFVHDANKNLLTVIFGNGFLSAHATKHMQDFAEMGIHNSDLGMIGYWNQFGLIPIIVFFTIIIKVLMSKACPFYIKAIAIHIIGCSLTISYFGHPTSMLWFSFMYYFYVYYTKENQIAKT